MRIEIKTTKEALVAEDGKKSIVITPPIFNKIIISITYCDMDKGKIDKIIQYINEINDQY